MPRSAGEFLEDMNAMQHQSMLSRMSGPGSADMLAGGLMSRGGAVGRPLLSGAMGMLQADPMSLGIRAGMGMWNMGAGVLGAGMTGVGVAAGAGIVGLGAAFAGHQMYSGAQQQLQLNQGLRQNFNFMNNQGGMGFTSAQGAQIGSSIRDMTHQFGPQGEVATFGELSRLATNMGRMGFAQNVRSVGEFKDKFKEMIDTLKKVAHDMGSSLEEAQKFTQSMRGSGIFKTADQLKMSAGTRIAASAAGLAMSEVTGMANIGSQISRSVGGLGSQGAFGGMRTIEQIGLAQKVGAISEADIYNATGLTGAEGRQALATSQMQQSARFLSGGRGRRFLASIAGKDGSLNEEAVMEYMMGGNMSTGRTMELAHQNLQGVGRANFIRNEGRLRGAALEKFGGLAQSMVYQQWLASRGYDPSSMNDKAMLAFQRFSGMGRDESDLAIKQIQAMPDMLREYADTKRNVGWADQLTARRNQTGMEGMRRKLDQARETVQGKLQSVGSKIFNSLQSEVEGWFNELTGAYVDMATEGLSEVTDKMRLGGPGAKLQYQRHFGMAGAGLLSDTPRVGAFTNNMSKMFQNQSLQFAAATGTSDKDLLGFAEMNREAIKLAALDSTGGSSAGMVGSYRAMLERQAKTDPAAAAALQKFNQASYSGKVGMIQGMQNAAGVEKSGQMLTNLQDQNFDMMVHSGITKPDEYMLDLGRRLSAGVSDDRFAKYERAGTAAQLAGVAYGTWTGIGRSMQRIASWTGLVDDIDTSMSSFYEDSIRGTNAITSLIEDTTGGNDRYRSIARTFQDRESMQLISDMYSGDKGIAGTARGDAMDRMQAIRGQKQYRDKGFADYSGDDQGRLQVLAGTSVGSKYGDLLDRAAKDGSVDISAAINEYRSMTGDTADDNDTKRLLLAMRSGGLQTMSKVHVQNLLKDLEKVSLGIAADRKSAQEMGYLHEVEDDDGTKRLVLTAKAAGQRAGMSKGEREADQMALNLANFDLQKPSEAALDKRLKDMNMSPEEYQKLDPDARNAISLSAAHEEYYEQRGAQNQKVGSLSLPEKLHLAKARAGTEIGEMAAYQAKVEQRFAGLTKSTGSAAGATGSLMGLDLSKEEQQTLAGMSQGEQAAFLARKAGHAGDEKFTAGISDALGKKTRGGQAASIDAFLNNLGDADKKKLQDTKAQSSDPSYRLMERMAKTQDENLKIMQKTLPSMNTWLEHIAKKTDPPEDSNSSRPPDMPHR